MTVPMIAGTSGAGDPGDGSRLGAEVARSATTGLVLVRDQVVVWLNAAARGLVEPYAGTWAGPGSPVPVLDGVRAGSRGASMWWMSPAEGPRRWLVSAGRVQAGILYEITDETGRLVADHRPAVGPDGRGRLARLEALTGQGSWLWNVTAGKMDLSDELAKLLGFAPGTVVDVEDMIDRYHPLDSDEVAAVLWPAVHARTPFHVVVRMFVDPEHSVERTFEMYGEPFVDPTEACTMVIGATRDITEQHRTRTELAYLAEHDPLTGVGNRRQLTRLLDACASDARGAALLMIDIDDFKDINNLRGHATGNRVISWVARTIGTVLRPEALLGRLGGDEFAVVVPTCHAAEAMALAEGLRRAVADPSPIDPVPRVTVSIGVAPVERGGDAESCFAQAGLALHAAKAAGRNRVLLYSPDQYRTVARRVSMLARVAAALDDGTMELDAQPIVDLVTGRATRHEVLIRLRDGLEPALGPADFLPQAERTDLVLELDRWVLRHTVAALATPAARAAGLRLEANLSGRSLEDTDLGPWVLELLGTADVEPHRLGLEITETAAVSSLDAARALAVRLTDAGCGIALDDFGAGYGSFTYLKHLPLTTVKIAGDFVRQLDVNRVDRALVTGIVGLARQLGMRTVAEEVSREELVRAVRTLCVEDGQGYHLGRPRPLRLLTDG